MEGNQVAAGVVIDAPANVAVPEVGTEMPVINRERWEAIQRMRAEGRSVSRWHDGANWIARRCAVACGRRSGAPIGEGRSAETLLSAHRAWLTRARAGGELLGAHSVPGIARGTRDYRGGYDTVRNAVRPLRTEAAAAALTQCRFETEPGQQGQVDWGQVRVRFVAGPAVVHVFVLTLGYSRRAWAEGYENEQLPRVAGGARARLRAFRRPTRRAALRSHAHGDHGAR